MTSPNITVDHDEYRRVAAELKSLAARTDTFAKEFETLPETMRNEIAAHLTDGQPGNLYDPASTAVGEVSGQIADQVPLLANNLRNIARSLEKLVDSVEEQQDSAASTFTTA